MVNKLNEGIQTKKIKIMDFCSINYSDVYINVYLYNSTRPGAKFDLLYEDITIGELRKLIGDLYYEYRAEYVMLIDFEDDSVTMSVHVG